MSAGASLAALRVRLSPPGRSVRLKVCEGSVRPQTLMPVVFVVLVCVLVAADIMAGIRPRSRREWMAVCAILVLLAWLLLGFTSLRSACLA